jgi:hypothetical protein
VAEPAPEARPEHRALEAMRAVLSDDHNYERGLAALHELVDRIMREEGEAGLYDLSVTLALSMARALEQIANDQGLAAVDLAEVWFAE